MRFIKVKQRFTDNPIHINIEHITAIEETAYGSVILTQNAVHSFDTKLKPEEIIDMINETYNNPF